MALKDRLNGTPFTCSNRRFNTHIARGLPHGRGHAHGSVFAQPLVNHSGWTLWLEHVTDREEGRDVFWFMWYDPDGTPTIPLSGVFDASDIQEMSKRLADFINVP